MLLYTSLLSFDLFAHIFYNEVHNKNGEESLNTEFGGSACKLTQDDFS